MADASELEMPNIHVYGFYQTLEMLPVLGSKDGDEVDNLGYKLDAKGAVIKAMQPEDWVIYSPAGQIQSSRITERVRWMRPDPRRVGEDPEGRKMAFASRRWEQIEPAYEAWKQGHDIPLNGTPLNTWPGLTKGEVEALHQAGVKTLEQLRDMNEAQIQKTRVPNLREKIKQAGLFLKNSNVAEAAAREAEKDQRIEALEAQIKELTATLKPRPQEAEGEDKGDEVAALKAELDARGIEYDGRWAAPKLRALLAEAEEA